MANEPKKVRQRRSMLQIPGVQTILSSLLCIVLGLLVGFVVLLLIDHGVSEKTGKGMDVDTLLGEVMETSAKDIAVDIKKKGLDEVKSNGRYTESGIRAKIP